MNNINSFYITTANKIVVEKIAIKVLEKKLIACANVIGNIKSYFTWRNKIHNSKEVIICDKITAKN